MPEVPHLKRTLCASAVALIMMLIVVGCQLEPTLLAAQSRIDGTEQVVTVTIRASDAQTIKRRQLYTWLVLANCSGPPEKFPSEPSIAGHRVPDFRFPVTGKTVDLVARVPTAIYVRYEHPCAYLEGGGYFTGKVRSPLIPISPPQGKGPSVSFKPRPLLGSA